MKKNQQEWSKARKTYEAIVCCLCIVIITMSILADISVLPLHEWIVIKVENVEDLFFTLFTVQASIATVSIAIISIITGLTNESIFGVSVSAYIAEIKPIFLKHKRVIIFNIGLTMINYACVALRWYNLSISLFVISTILTVVLVKDVYMIFRGRQRIEEEIHTYTLSNYDVSYLSNLNAEMLNAVDAGNTLVLKKDIEIILEIFENETRDSEYTGTEITNLRNL